MRNYDFVISFFVSLKYCCVFFMPYAPTVSLKEMFDYKWGGGVSRDILCFTLENKTVVLTFCNLL